MEGGATEDRKEARAVLRKTNLGISAIVLLTTLLTPS
jgi:hypothetical protein